MADRARRNIMLNGLDNARVVDAAASDQACETVLYRPGAFDCNRARASLRRHPYLTGAAVTVPAVTLDEVCDGRVALIKIDVEGHEAAVVRGAAGVIDRDAPVLSSSTPRSCSMTRARPRSVGSRSGGMRCSALAAPGTA